jgi:hypothetical protein
MELATKFDGKCNPPTGKNFANGLQARRNIRRHITLQPLGRTSLQG